MSISSRCSIWRSVAHRSCGARSAAENSSKASSATNSIWVGPIRSELLFPRKITRATPGPFTTRVITAGVNPSLHIAYKRCHIKQYFKQERALRTEITFNDTHDFGVGRRLSNLSYLRTLGDHINRRVLETECLAHDWGLAPGSTVSKRYVLTPCSRCVALFLTKLHARVIRPGLQALDLSAVAQAPPPLRTAFAALDRAIDIRIAEAQFAA